MAALCRQSSQHPLANCSHDLISSDPNCITSNKCVSWKHDHRRQWFWSTGVVRRVRARLQLTQGTAPRRTTVRTIQHNISIVRNTSRGICNQKFNSISFAENVLRSQKWSSPANGPKMGKIIQQLDCQAGKLVKVKVKVQRSRVKICGRWTRAKIFLVLSFHQHHLFIHI